MSRETSKPFIPLIFCAGEQQILAVRRLLTVPNLDVNQVNDDGVTALMAASLANDGEMVRLLLQDNRINAEFKTSWNMTAEQICAILGKKFALAAFDDYYQRWACHSLNRLVQSEELALPPELCALIASFVFVTIKIPKRCIGKSWRVVS